MLIQHGASLGPTAIEGIAANAHTGALSHASDSGLMNSLQGHKWVCSHTVDGWNPAPPAIYKAL